MQCWGGCWILFAREPNTNQMWEQTAPTFLALHSTQESGKFLAAVVDKELHRLGQRRAAQPYR